MKKLRVLHTPHNNGGHRFLISRHERKLGIKSDLVVLPDQPFYKNYDRCLHINSKTIPNEIKRYLFLKEAIKNYDVFHFNAGSSILDHPFPGLNLMDLGMIKRAGKKIIVTYQGDDCRQKDYLIKHYNLYYRSRGYSLNDWYLDTNKRTRVRRFNRFADHIFAISPDIMNFLPERAELLPTCVELGELKPRRKRADGKIRIVHAPSDRGIKGTEEILNTIKELSLEYPIELILIEKMTHEQAVEAYRQCDIGVDQLVVGWYGTFAVELMAMGIPVVAFLRESDLAKFVPWQKEIPVVNANKNQLKEALIVLIENKKLREDLGERGMSFVKKRHNPTLIAKRLKEVYEE